MEKEPNKAQDLLPKDFFKQSKSKEDFHSFFNDLFKQGVEEMLQAELDEHLGYQKHSKEGKVGIGGNFLRLISLCPACAG